MQLALVLRSLLRKAFKGMLDSEYHSLSRDVEVVVVIDHLERLGSCSHLNT